MSVTRTRLAAPPEPAQHAPVDPKAEARQHRDTLKLIGYFGARAGQWRTIAQIVAGTRLPIGRAYDALDYLVASGELIKHNEHLTRAGTTTPAWIRRDPTPGSGA